MNSHTSGFAVTPIKVEANQSTKNSNLHTPIVFWDLNSISQDKSLKKSQKYK